MARPDFIAERNLARLTRWLRILGYDTLNYKNISFNNLIRIARRDRRIVLTRNQKHAKSNYKFSRVLIKSDNLEKQLRELDSFITFDEKFLFTRCPNCNKILFLIDKRKIVDLIPEKVYKNFAEFKVCRRCGKIYWQGTHYRDFKAKLESLFK